MSGATASQKLSTTQLIHHKAMDRRMSEVMTICHSRTSTAKRSETTVKNDRNTIVPSSQMLTALPEGKILKYPKDSKGKKRIRMACTMASIIHATKTLRLRNLRSMPSLYKAGVLKALSTGTSRSRTPKAMMGVAVNNTLAS